MSVRIHVRLLSDACFAGAGSGRPGDADVETELDPMSGLPVIRGRTLKGLFVEELAAVLNALESSGAGPWHNEAGRLFGVPGEASSGALGFSDGRLPDDLRSEVARGRWSPESILRALTVVRSQTRMRNGAPVRGSLRSTRLVRAGLGFTCPIACPSPLSSRGKALIAACAASLARAGLHRNHGWGEVEVGVWDGTGSASLDRTAPWLRLLDQPDQAVADEPVAKPRLVTAASDVVTKGMVVTYRLRLEAPVVLADSGGDESTVETLPFVSGSAVLGAMAERWLSDRSCKDPCEAPEFRRLFLGEGVRWLHAYPASESLERLVPCPISFVVRKQEANPGLVFDRAAVDFDPGDEEWGPLKDHPFIRVVDEDALRTRGRRVRITARLHHQRRDREAGRPTSGDLYSYVAIEAGETFVGHVLCESRGDADTVRQLLTAGSIRLGRSRSATYGGHAVVEVMTETPGSLWSEVPQNGLELGGALVVTLLSDVLGRNETGQADPQAAIAAIGAKLGLGSPKRAYLAGRPISGYVSAWRMPRPIHPALRAGSVLVYKTTGPIPDAVMSELRWQGVGERRQEGFGRVAVDWHGCRSTMPLENETAPSPSAGEATTAPHSPELRTLERNLLFDALRAALVAQGRDDARHLHGELSPALVARLRGNVRAATGTAGVLEFIESLADKRAGRSLRQARCRDKSMTKWLSHWLAGEAPEWRTCQAVTETTRRTGLGIGVLWPGDEWRLVQAHLDAFLEAARRSQQVESRDRPAVAEPEVVR